MCVSRGGEEGRGKRRQPTQHMAVAVAAVVAVIVVAVAVAVAVAAAAVVVVVALDSHDCIDAPLYCTYSKLVDDIAAAINAATLGCVGE